MSYDSFAEFLTKNTITIIKLENIHLPKSSRFDNRVVHKIKFCQMVRPHAIVSLGYFSYYCGKQVIFVWQSCRWVKSLKPP